MGKLMRRAELQQKYDGVLQWSIPRKVSIRISDYARQETILEWIVDNKTIYGKLYPSVWREFLKYVEKHPDISLMEMLDTFKDGYPLLQALKDQQFWAVVRLLKIPVHEWPVGMRARTRGERNSDALCWTCTNLDYDPIYEHAPSQSTKTEWLWHDTSIMAGLDNDPVDSPSLRTCHPLPVCPVRGVVIHKGYTHCSSYSEGSQTSRTNGV